MRKCLGRGRRLCALFLAAAMCAGLLQLPAFAAESHEHNADGWVCLCECTEEHEHTDSCWTCTAPAEVPEEPEDSGEAESAEPGAGDAGDPEVPEIPENPADPQEPMEPQEPVEPKGPIENEDSQEPDEEASGDAALLAEGEPESVTINTLDELQKAVQASGTVKLGEDITGDKPASTETTDSVIVIPKGVEVTLDLNGKTLSSVSASKTAYSGRVITVRGTLTLIGDGEITGGLVGLKMETAANGGGILVDGGSLIMEGGTIKANYIYHGNGAGVALQNDGSFTLNGGTIEGNIAVNDGGCGGGVYIGDGCEFTMTGGMISDNTGFCGGGGVFLEGETAAFKMTGGTIKGNRNLTSLGGGGVFVSMGTFTMENGEISGNNNTTVASSAHSFGGGVHVNKGGTFEMTGGKITGNGKGEKYKYWFPPTNQTVYDILPTRQGGGVSAMYGTIILTGGEISNNYGYLGGGVYVDSGHGTGYDGTKNYLSKLVIGGSVKITGNESGCYGGGVAVNYAEAVMNGGEISGNTALYRGGGVWVQCGDFTMEGGSIAGNKVTSEISGQGGAIFNHENPNRKLFQDYVGPSTVTINGGTIKDNTAAYANKDKYCSGGILNWDGRLVVNGGGMTCPQSQYTVESVGGSVDVTGGNIRGYRTIYARDGAAVAVSGNATIYGSSRGIQATGIGTTLDIRDADISSYNYCVDLLKGAEGTIGEGANIHVTGSRAAVTVWGPGGESSPENPPTKLTVNDGTIVGYTHGIAGNGTNGKDGDYSNTEIVINGGDISSTDGMGIYHPQAGDLTITGGKIHGVTGIDIRAGNLTIPAESTAVISGDYTYDYSDGVKYYGYGASANKSGGTTYGVGISVSQHTTNLPINVNIAGGTVQGYYALTEEDLMDQDNQNVTVAISGGLFESNVQGREVTRLPDNPFEAAGKDWVWEHRAGDEGYGPAAILNNQDRKNYITGGTFSNDVQTDPNENVMVADTYASHPIRTPEGAINTNGYYNVHQPDPTGISSDSTGHWHSCRGYELCTWTAGDRTGHTYDAGVVTRQPQVGVTGVRTFTCTVCGHTRTETIAVLTGGGGGGGGTGGGGGGGGGRPGQPAVNPNPGGTTIDDQGVPLAGDLGLNRDDHFAYVKGYSDGTVRPNNYITRAQVATIFYRLLTDSSRAIYEKETNDFTDVPDSYWANKAISTLSNAGIISGFSDGTFRPNANITRAQFAAIASRFDQVVPGMENPFSDVAENYWAREQIAYAASKGWISGYEDGTFRPNANITRAAAMKLINSVLNRHVDQEGLLENAAQWSDNKPADWHYFVVLEATNSHDFTRRAEGESMENWTALKEDPVWD